MKVVSRGVLRHQAEQLEQTKGKCTIVTDDGLSFTVEETIEKQIQKDIIIQRRAQRIVSWNEATNQVHCTCNELVHRGMPCLHISLVAIEKEYQIPLACFHERFRYRQEELASLPPSFPPQDPSPSVQQPQARDEVHVVSSGTLHITESGFNAKYGDEESVLIRGRLQVIERRILEGLKPLTSYDVVQSELEKIDQHVKLMIERLKNERETQQGAVVPHATRPNTRNSYKTVPLQVARASAEMIERERREGDPSTQEQSSQPNKRRRSEDEDD